MSHYELNYPPALPVISQKAGLRVQMGYFSSGTCVSEKYTNRSRILIWNSVGGFWLLDSQAVCWRSVHDRSRERVAENLLRWVADSSIQQVTVNSSNNLSRFSSDASDTFAHGQSNDSEEVGFTRVICQQTECPISSGLHPKMKTVKWALRLVLNWVFLAPLMIKCQQYVISAERHIRWTFLLRIMKTPHKWHVKNNFKELLRSMRFNPWGVIMVTWKQTSVCINADHTLLLSPIMLCTVTASSHDWSCPWSWTSLQCWTAIIKSPYKSYSALRWW